MAKKIKRERVSGQPVSNEDLLADLKKCALALNKEKITQKEYRSLGRFNDTTVSRRFGSWNDGLKAAGLKLSNETAISDLRLFENILSLWQQLGRQPRRSELVLSEFSQSPYNRRFGSWSKALDAFTKYVETKEIRIDGNDKNEGGNDKRGPREPSLRLRYKVLCRDKYKCCICGASPAKNSASQLHVDHKVPWSKGGTTSIENLQTLCSKCNLGKSNLD